ncbi:YdcF family protein [Fischerella sp. PCC 9605]|uniref:YdcF family protein n=1 Tax=Fischerella sp. PCC 9605 TaxID=1173024 RepID=UPI00055729D6|nr:YdcF family protein [Fischerella sp. PCC 9605]
MLLSYRFKKRYFALAVICLTPVILPVIAITAFSIYLYNSKNNIHQADAAIVLGAAAWEDKPSPVFRERINHAINLYKTGNVHNIIFTGGIGKNSEYAEAIVGKQYAIAHGVKKSDILIEAESLTTLQNIKNALKVASSTQLSKFLIVSDPLHLKRAVLMAQDLGMDAHPSGTPTSRYRSFKSKLKFLVRETYSYFIYLLLRI